MTTNGGLLARPGPSPDGTCLRVSHKPSWDDLGFHKISLGLVGLGFLTTPALAAGGGGLLRRPAPHPESFQIPVPSHR